MSPSEEHREVAASRAAAPGRSRRKVLLVVALVVALGLALRWTLPGEAGSVVGAILYTALIYFLAVLAFRSLRATNAAALAFVLSTVIELVQLTPVPALLSSYLPLAAWVLGSTFSPIDLISYAAGALIALRADRFTHSRTAPAAHEGDSLVSAEGNGWEKGARARAVGAVLGFGVPALFVGPSVVDLVRERLHIGCSMIQQGSEGGSEWFCGDGIGYVGVAITLGGMWLLSLVIGALVAGMVRHDRGARIALVVLSGAPVGWILGWTWYGSSTLVQDRYSPITGIENRAASVGPSALVAAAAFVLAAASLFFTGQAARILNLGGVEGLLIATLLQLGLAINTLPAAGLIAAAAVRIRPTGRGPSTSAIVNSTTIPGARQSPS